MSKTFTLREKLDMLGLRGVASYLSPKGDPKANGLAGCCGAVALGPEATTTSGGLFRKGIASMRKEYGIRILALATKGDQPLPELIPDWEVLVVPDVAGNLTLQWEDK